MKNLVQRIWELGFEAGGTDQKLFRAKEALETLKRAREEALRRVDEQYATLLEQAQRKVDRLTEALDNRKEDLVVFADSAFDHQFTGNVFSVFRLIESGTKPSPDALCEAIGNTGPEVKQRIALAVSWLSFNGLIEPPVEK